jgi:hypothetical protein
VFKHLTHAMQSGYRQKVHFNEKPCFFARKQSG